VKPSRASFAVDASAGLSNKTCAIFTLAPAAFGVGDGATCVDWKPLYLSATFVINLREKKGNMDALLEQHGEHIVCYFLGKIRAEQSCRWVLRRRWNSGFCEER